MPTIDPNDPRLTAYALDEMTAPERAAFEQQLANDPAARATVDDLRRAASLISEALAQEPLPARAVELPPPRPRWLRRLVLDNWTIWVPLAGAAAFALFFWGVYLPAYNRDLDARQLAATRDRANLGPSGIPAELAPPDGSGPALATTGPAGHFPVPSPGPGFTAGADHSVKTGHFLTASQHPTSTFGVDVDGAAYLDVRRLLEAGERPPTGLVRIEEMVNYFAFHYPPPASGDPLAVSAELHAAPWATDHKLVRIGLQGGETAPAAPVDERSIHAARERLTVSAGDEIRAVARDVKIQVDFNPDKVLAYRLIGYENRLIRNDTASGDVGRRDLAAGRSVTALYEIIPLPAPAPARPALAAARPAAAPAPAPTDTAEWLTVKLRYAEPGSPQSRSVVVPLHANSQAEIAAASPDFQFAAAVAGFGLILQDNPNKGAASWDMIENLARSGLANDDNGQRGDFVALVRKARAVEPVAIPAPNPPPATP